LAANRRRPQDPADNLPSLGALAHALVAGLPPAPQLEVVLQLQAVPQLGVAQGSKTILTQGAPHQVGPLIAGTTLGLMIGTGNQRQISTFDDTLSILHNIVPLASSVSFSMYFFLARYNNK